MPARTNNSAGAKAKSKLNESERTKFGYEKILSFARKFCTVLCSELLERTKFGYEKVRVDFASFYFLNLLIKYFLPQLSSFSSNTYLRNGILEKSFSRQFS